VAAARKAEAAGEVAGEIERLLGPGRALGVRADVRAEDDVDAMVAAARGRFGRIDVLVNNTVITPNACILDMPFEEFNRVLGTNLGGQELAAQRMAPVMIEGGGGRIINMTSARGVVGAPGLAAYSASKAAINNFTNVLHQELAERGLRTVGLVPGLTDTPGMRRAVARSTYTARRPDVPRRPARAARGPRLLNDLPRERRGRPPVRYHHLRPPVTASGTPTRAKAPVNRRAGREGLRTRGPEGVRLGSA